MSTALALPAELTIYAVADAARAWQPWLDRDPAAERLAVDASGVADIDGAGVQLLMALANALQQRGRALELVAPSAALAAACTRLGASFLLALAHQPESAA